MRRLLVAAGVTFVSAWIIGLVLAASGPKPSDSATKIAGYFAAHEHKAMIAHLLIDGVAGAAIGAIAYSLRHYLAGGGRLPKVMFVAGIAAGLASWAQAVVGGVRERRGRVACNAGPLVDSSSFSRASTMNGAKSGGLPRPTTDGAERSSLSRTFAAGLRPL